MLTVQVDHIKPNWEDLFDDTPIGNRVVSCADGGYSLLKYWTAFRKQTCQAAFEINIGTYVEENRPLDTGDEKQRDDDKPVLREQCDGAQHEQGRSCPNLFAEYIVSVRCFSCFVYGHSGGTAGRAGRAWASLGVGAWGYDRKYVRRRRNVGAGRVTTEGRRTRQKQDDAGTYRSLAGPLVKGVESLTMNGC